jgi:putative ABC transport system permease protein
MRRLHRLASILSWLFRRDDAERRLDDEMHTFVEMSAAEKVRDGCSPAEARRLALIELGGLEQAKERVRTERHGAWLDEIGRDVRYAFRMFAAQRSATAVILATLALAIGANTAIFSIVNSLLLRELPVREPGRLAILTTSEQRTWTYPIWEELQRHSASVDGALAWSTFDSQFNLTRGGETQFVRGLYVSGNAFNVLGVPAVQGRTLMPADDVKGGGENGPVAMISHAFWRRHFGGAPDAIGRTLMLEGTPVTIVGVAPPEFFGLNVGRSFDVAIPFAVEPLVRGEAESRLKKRTSWWMSIMVRLKAGQTADQASMMVQAAQTAIREATRPPGLTSAEALNYLSEPLTLDLAPSGRSGLREQYREPLMVMLVVVGLVLLIACANVANLLLARATARSHEWSVRLALGASRTRLLRQALTESLLLAVVGAAAGLLIAQWGSALLVGQLSGDAVTLDLALDRRILAFTAVLTIVAALVFGVAPAARSASGAPIDAMKESGRNNARTGRTALADGLVVAQVVLSVVLVAGAGLFLRTFGALVSVPLGLEPSRVLLVEMDARRSTVSPEARASTYDRIRQRVAAVPGVASASLSVITPVSGAMWSRRVEVSGSPMPRVDTLKGPEGFGFTDAAIPDDEPLAVFNAIAPDWLGSFGMTLVAGRDVTVGDTQGSTPVALVNQAFARKFLQGQPPIGHTVRAYRDTTSPVREIVGVVADAVYRDIRETTLPTVYIPLAQYIGDGGPYAPSEVTLSVRTSALAPSMLTKSVAAAIGEISSSLALTSRPMNDTVDDTLMQQRLLAWLSTAFGVLALLLAAVGLYGVTSYSVSLRRTEIGIRLALGATRGAVVGLVLGRVSALVGIGVIVGLALAAWTSRFVMTLLYGLQPGDPLTLASSAIVLATIGTVAGWLPAHRASRLDPSTVLRDG